MKYNILFFIIGTVLMSGCSATMYHGYVDELYTIPESSPQYAESSDVSGRVVQTVEDIDYDTEDPRIIYDNEETYGSYDSHFTFSIMSPGFYVGVGSQGWGGWFYPYYGPHVAYHYSPWSWDPFWHTSFYSWYWDPFMMHSHWYNPWYSHYGGYYGGFYGWNNNHYWGFNSGTNRTTISHRESSITHRRPNNGQQIRPTAVTNAVRQNIRPIRSSGVSVRDEESVVRNSNNKISRDIENKPDGAGSRGVSNVVRSENKLSRESSAGAIKHTRETQRFNNQSTTTPIRTTPNVGGDRYKPASGSTGNNNYRSKENQNSNAYRPISTPRQQTPATQSVQPTNNSNSRRNTGRTIESNYSKPTQSNQSTSTPRNQSVSSPSRGSSNSGSSPSGNSSSPRGNSGSRGSSGSSPRTR
ncbi:MAG: hypothetical protein PHU27_02250 [Salinivirgaceae bacterium]|nr:hypothetical protein [Salinivirgaceae bacterium]MDD4746860.1 hypothetical protein [Salinivirgaceae bacterium]MDY0279079.1 hypothetical protein [Salinivirgaceae bacterium]